MGLIEKTVDTVQKEWDTISTTLGRSWDGLTPDEKYMVFGLVATVLVLMFMARMRRARARDYIKADARNRNLAFFYGAIAIIVAFAFGVEALIEGAA